MPLTGHDGTDRQTIERLLISIHMPLTGHDLSQRLRSETNPHHFNPHAPYGARPSNSDPLSPPQNFNPHAPYGARHVCPRWVLVWQNISIHMPLTGHDCVIFLFSSFWSAFQSTCPLRGTTRVLRLRAGYRAAISIHMPLTGHDLGIKNFATSASNFNPHAPYGARQWRDNMTIEGNQIFQSTCPLRGTTAGH